MTDPLRPARGIMVGLLICAAVWIVTALIITGWLLP